MAEYRLWPATNGPASSAAAAVGGVSAGVEFFVSTTAWVTALHFYRPDTALTGPVPGRIATITGTELGDEVSFTLSSTGWHTALFEKPIPLVANQRYVAYVHYPVQWPVTVNYWNSGAGAGGITNGILTAPSAANATGNDQNLRLNSTSLTFPGGNSASNKGCYWVDVTVTDVDPTRANLVPNPSFETGVHGWATNGDPLLREQAPQAPQAGGWYAFTRLVPGGDLDIFSEFIVVTAGTAYTGSVSVNRDGTGPIRCDLHWYDSVGGYLGVNNTSSTPASGVWSRSSVTATAPAGAVFARLQAKFQAMSPGWYVRVDAALVEPGTVLRPYGDGDSFGWEWTGTPHASASRTLPLFVTHAGAATLAAGATLTGGSPSVGSRATLPASGSLTTDARLREYAAATLPASGTLTARSTVHAAALLGGTAALTASGVRFQLAAATLEANAALGAQALLPTGSSVLAAEAELAANGMFEGAAEALLKAEGGLSATEWLTAHEVVALNAIAEMPAGGFAEHFITTTLPGTSGLVTNAGVPGAGVQLVAAAGLAATAWQTHQAAVDLLGTSLLLIGGAGTQLASADLGGQSALNVGPILVAAEAATLPGDAELGIAEHSVIPLSVDLSAGSLLAVDGVREQSAGAALVVVSGLVVDASPPAKVGNVDLPAEAAFGAAAQVVAVTVAPMPGSALLVADAFTFTPLFVGPSGRPVPQTPVPTVRLLVVDTITGKLHFELPYTSLSWNSPLNGIGKASASLPIQDVLESVYEQGAASPRNALREVLLGPYRWSLVVAYGNVALWGGPYLPSDDAADGKISIGAAAMETMLERRLLVGSAPGDTTSLTDASRDVAFHETTPRAAVYRIVDHAISTYDGALPTRAMPIVCSMPPPLLGDESFTYLAYDLTPAWKAITDIIERDDGPDVRLEPELYEGAGGLYVRWDLQIGDPFLPASGAVGPEGPMPWTFDDVTGILTRTTDAVGLASSWYTTGDGQDREKKIARAITEQFTKLGFPVLEHVDSGSTSESEQVKLDAWAKAALAAHQSPMDSWSLSVPVDGQPPLGAVKRGETARIDVRNTLLLEPGYYERRITEVSGDATSGMFSLACEQMEEPYVPSEPEVVGGIPDEPTTPSEQPNRTARRIAWITGESTSNRTVTNAKVGATDLGIPFDDGRGNVLVAFGDTFLDTVGGADWRSNVLARTRNTDYATRGTLFDWWLTDTPGHAKQFIPRDAGGNDFTIIPTSGITIGTRSYVTYFSIFEWGDAGRWRTNYAGYAYSDDGGVTWSKPTTARWQNNASWTDLWQMNALVRGRGDGYVYMFGTPNGRAGSAYLARVPENQMLTMSAYQQLAIDGSWVQWRGAVPPKAVIPAPVSELSVMYHTYYNQWLAAYYKESVNAVVVHTAPDVTGPWSAPITVATAQEYPNLYGFFFHPWSAFDRYPVALMSQWPPYNVEAMRLRLDPGGPVPEEPEDPGDPDPVLPEVQHWVDEFESIETNFWTTHNAKSLSGDSYAMYGLRYGLDGYTALWEATGDTHWLDRALELLQNVVDSAVPVPGGFLGWLSATRPGYEGEEVPLDETHCLAPACRLLRVTPTTGTYGTRRTELAEFLSVNLWDKWMRDINHDVLRGVTHIESHWGVISMNLHAVTGDPAQRDLAETILDRFAGQLHDHPTRVGAVWWDTGIGQHSRPGQDVSHGNALVSMVIDAADLGYEGWDEQIPRLCRLTHFVLDEGDPEYIDGSGTELGVVISEWTRLGGFDLALHARLEDHPHTNAATTRAQAYANLAKGASRLASG